MVSTTGTPQAAILLPSQTPPEAIRLIGWPSKAEHASTAQFEVHEAMVRASHTLCGIHRAGSLPLIASTAGALGAQDKAGKILPKANCTNPVTMDYDLGRRMGLDERWVRRGFANRLG